MSRPDDSVSLAAHNAFILYSNYLSSIQSATVPRHWAEELLRHVSALLDENDDLHLEQGTYNCGVEDEFYEVEEIKDWGADGPPDDQLEAGY